MYIFFKYIKNNLQKTKNIVNQKQNLIKKRG